MLTPKRLSAEIGSIVISDLVIIQISDVYPRGSDFTWPFLERFTQGLVAWIFHLKWGPNDPSLFWNAAKAVIRVRIMSYVATYKQKTKLAYDTASSKLREAYTAFKTCSSPQNKEQWSIAKTELELWVERRENLYHSRYDPKLFCFGNTTRKAVGQSGKVT